MPIRYPKLDANRDYFKMPNCLFSIGLSSGEIAIYAYLLRCENRETYTCYPSAKTIGRAVQMSKNTVRKYLNSLEEKGLIETERTSIFHSGLKCNGNLKIHVLPIQNALRIYNEQQAA